MSQLLCPGRARQQLPALTPSSLLSPGRHRADPSGGGNFLVARGLSPSRLGANCVGPKGRSLPVPFRLPESSQGTQNSPHGGQSRQRDFPQPGRGRRGGPRAGCRELPKGSQNFPAARSRLLSPRVMAVLRFPRSPVNFGNFAGEGSVRSCSWVGRGELQQRAPGRLRAAGGQGRAGSCRSPSRGRHYKMRRSLVRPFPLRAPKEGADRAAWRNPSVLRLCSSSC